MYYLSKLCFICLGDDSVQNILDLNEENLEQISFVLSEIIFVEASTHVYICSSCNVKLQSFYKFKKKGLESYCYTQNIIREDEESGDSKKNNQQLNSCFICLDSEELQKKCVHYGKKCYTQLCFVLPEIAMSEIKLPLHLCSTCLSELKYFYSLKTRCLESFCRWTNLPDKLCGNSDTQNEHEFAELRIRLGYGVVTLEEPILPLEVQNEGFPLNQIFKQYIVTDIIPANQRLKYRGQFEIASADVAELNTTHSENALIEVDTDNMQLDETPEENNLEKKSSDTDEQNLHNQKPKRDHKKWKEAEKPKPYNENYLLYKCILCKNDYCSKSALKNHIKSKHLNIWNHKCLDCGMKFETKNRLETHKKIHLESRDFRCSVCRKIFIRESKLIIHKKLKHYNEKVLECMMCQDLFPDHLSLTNHLNNNDDDDTTCDICNETYCSNAAMLKHQKKQHGIYQEIMLDKYM